MDLKGGEIKIKFIYTRIVLLTLFEPLEYFDFFDKLKTLSRDMLQLIVTKFTLVKGISSDKNRCSIRDSASNLKDYDWGKDCARNYEYIPRQMPFQAAIGTGNFRETVKHFVKM